MNKNVIQFIVDENRDYISIPVGTVKAKSNLTTRIQLVTPITSSVAVNYLIYDSKNIEKKQYLIPTGDLGSAVVDPSNPNYQEVAGWKVYEADIYAPILSVISKYKTGKVGMSFEFVQQVPNALCTNFSGYFGFTKELPETASDGDYYICEDYDFWIGENLYNKGDILVWYGEKWHNGGIFPKGLTETVDISVDPAISYPTEEVDETAFGNALGEIAEDVAELDTRLNGVETDLNGKQDKTDLLLDTASKTVVGAINEVYDEIEALEDKVELVIPKANGAVRFDITQTLSDSEKSRARVNIGVSGDGKIDMIIVNELPEVGEPSTIYLLPNENPESSNLYTEWIYINDEWEMWGVSNIDLSDYITYTQDDANVGKTFVVGEDGIVELVDFPTISVNGIDYLKDPDKTYLVIKTPADNDIFTLFTGTTDSPNYTIEWGDGSSENITGTVNPPHEYETAGMYLITISGNFENGFMYEVGSDDVNDSKNKIIEVYGGSNYPLAIGQNAFRRCSSLTTADFPNATSIDTGAFTSCPLTTANFPNVTVIDDGSFEECSSLTTANFPNATSIGYSAFYRCTALTSANFPNVTSIGDLAFRNCSSLKELTLGNVTTTATGTRFGNVKLTTLTIAQDVTTTDIERIATFFKANGGTFIGSETKHGLQVEKTPTADNDVVRKVDLTDYAKEIWVTSNHYNKTEIDQMISIGLKIEVVAELPTEDIRTDTIYLVPKSGEGADNYDEYIYLEGTQAWEHIGSTDVDLTNYYTKTETDTKLDDLEDETLTLLNNKLQTVSDEATAETQSLANPDNYYFFEEE